MKLWLRVQTEKHQRVCVCYNNYDVKMLMWFVVSDRPTGGHRVWAPGASTPSYTESGRRVSGSRPCPASGGADWDRRLRPRPPSGTWSWKDWGAGLPPGRKTASENRPEPALLFLQRHSSAGSVPVWKVTLEQTDDAVHRHAGWGGGGGSTDSYFSFLSQYTCPSCSGKEVFSPSTVSCDEKEKNKTN